MDHEPDVDQRDHPRCLVGVEAQAAHEPRQPELHQLALGRVRGATPGPPEGEHGQPQRSGEEDVAHPDPADEDGPEGQTHPRRGEHARVRVEQAARDQAGDPDKRHADDRRRQPGAHDAVAEQVEERRDQGVVQPLPSPSLGGVQERVSLQHLPRQMGVHRLVQVEAGRHGGQVPQTQKEGAGQADQDQRPAEPGGEGGLGARAHGIRVNTPSADASTSSRVHNMGWYSMFRQGSIMSS